MIVNSVFTFMYVTDNPMKQNPKPKMPEMGKAIKKNQSSIKNEEQPQ